MRIVQLTPGSGEHLDGEISRRDAALGEAFRRAGHEVIRVELFTPTISAEAAPAPLFLGGLNLSLQHRFSLFRQTPRWLDRRLDHPGLLRRLVGRSVAMSPAVTLSLLDGAGGRCGKEIRRLVDWLAGLEDRPELILCSSLLHAPLAAAIRERLDVPQVCLMQDELAFLERCSRPQAEQARQRMAEQAGAFDLLVAVSEYYKRQVSGRLDLDPDPARLTAMPMGLAADRPAPTALPEAPTVGFLSRIGDDGGLDILVTAVHLLRRDQRLKTLKLRIAGRARASDRAFLQKIHRRVQTLRMSDRVEFVPADSDRDRRAFLDGVTLTVLPMRTPPAYGLCALESLAAGRPFAAPEIGVFPDIANNTGAGVLYGPNNPVKLAETLRPLLLDTAATEQLGLRGAAAVRQRYAMDETVRLMLYTLQGRAKRTGTA